MEIHGPYRALRNPEAVAARRKMLDLPHVAPLRDFASDLRSMQRGDVPDFDPLDGGTAARVLFLFEKPGPMTSISARGSTVGSGFISRDNDDPTGEATYRFMAQALIGRELTLTWNLIPWWNGTRCITADEVRAGTSSFKRLLDLLPDLTVVVLVGRRAGRAKQVVQKCGLPFIESAHPSPIVRASRPAVWHPIPDQWSQVRIFL